MRRKLLWLVVSALLAFSTFAFSACTKQTGEKIDHTKTQLYVCNYNGGFGEEWLKKAKTRFEAAHAEDSYESGKTGVQVVIHNTKDSGSTINSRMSTTTDEVFFAESVYYYDFVAGDMLLDITDMVEEKLTAFGEIKSVEDKLTDEQKNYFRTPDGKYYGLPHYSGFIGIVFDVDLFESVGLYFSKDEDNGNDGFVYGKGDQFDREELSAGPDGIEGTYDDGLPVTFDDFFKLCDYIKENRIIPMSWAGQYPSYPANLMTSFWADYEGREQMMLNYTFKGTATNLVTVSGGTVTPKGDVEISEQNGYELHSQRGKYEALNFMDRLVDTSKAYCYDKSFNKSQSQMGAQEDYLYGGKVRGKDSIAMMIEGNWWENEASGIFESVVESTSKNNARGVRRFGLMPMPKAEGAHEGLTLIDNNVAACFINKNIKEFKKDLARSFLQFCHTDESLREFNITTNCPKAYNYDTDSIKNSEEMTYFGKWVMEMKDNAEVVYPYSSNSLYLDYQSEFIYYQNIWANGSTYDAANVLRQSGKTADNYFGDMINHRNQGSWNNRYSKYWA